MSGHRHRERTPWGEEVERWAQGLRRYSDDTAPEEDVSDQMILARALLGAAAEEAQGRSLRPEHEASIKLMDEAARIAELIVCAYGGSRTDEEDPAARWSMTSVAEPIHFVEDIRRRGQIPVDRGMLESGAWHYVEGSLRDRMVDRLLIKGLVSMELAEFVYEMVVRDAVTGMSRLAKARREPWQEWWLGRLRTGGVLAAGVAVAGVIDWVWEGAPARLVSWATGVALTTFVVMSVLAGVLTAAEGRRGRNADRKIMDLVDAARDWHTEFRGAGPVSVPHLRRSLDELRAKGFVLPAPVWALLDDVERRDVVVL